MTLNVFESVRLFDSIHTLGPHPRYLLIGPASSWTLVTSQVWPRVRGCARNFQSPHSPSARANVAYWSSKKPGPRDVTCAAEGPSACAYWNVARHCAIIENCRKNPDNRVSIEILFQPEFAMGFSGMESKSWWRNFLELKVDQFLSQ